MHLADAQELFVLQGRIHEICVVVKNLNSVSKITEEIETIIANPQLDVETWKEFAASFYRAMIADQKGSWIMLVIIALVVAVGVLNTVLMTVLERRREYGVLRAVGTAPSQIFKLVVLEVLIMAVIGICLGFGISLPANYYLSLDGIAMPEPMTYGGIEFTHMYTEINARSYIIPALTVFLTAFIVSIFPAGRAARVAPARAMRIH
jgi:ABC-type lipoprotein release transport system permease subunit